MVDGTDLHLSHWTGNKTPKQYLSDLSTECAFKFIETEEDSSIWKDAIIVNNHFDTDGLLSVWALMEPEKAREHKAKMLAAAAAGDFDEWGVSERGLQLNFAFLNIAKSASAEDADAYALLLPQVESLLETIDDREDLWGMDMEEVREADDLWADDIIKSSRVIDDKSRFSHASGLIGDIGVVELPPGRDDVPAALLSRMFPWVIPGLGPSIARILIARDLGDGTYHYRYERPHYGWVETLTRPKVAPVKAAELVDGMGPGWRMDSDSLSSICRTTTPARDPPREAATRLLTVERGLLPRLA